MDNDQFKKKYLFWHIKKQVHKVVATLFLSFVSFNAQFSFVANWKLIVPDTLYFAHLHYFAAENCSNFGYRISIAMLCF